MRTANADMVAAWDGPEGQHWTEHAERYEAIGATFEAELLRQANIAGSEHIADVGCGTGSASRAAARLAPRGTVTGFDLSGSMLERARHLATVQGLTNAAFIQADVQVHPFPPAALDCVISNFGSMFFCEPTAAFTNLAAGLRPDGRIALLVWRSLSDNEWLSEIRRSLAAGRALPTPPQGAPGPFGLADRVRTQQMLLASGFIDIAIEALDAPMRFGSDTEDAFAFVSTLGISRGLLSGLSESACSAALDALRAMLDSHDTPTGVELNGAAWVITARRAAA